MEVPKARLADNGLNSRCFQRFATCRGTLTVAARERTGASGARARLVRRYGPGSRKVPLEAAMLHMRCIRTWAATKIHVSIERGIPR